MIEYNKNSPLRVFTAFSGYDSQCLALERLERAYPDFAYMLVGWSEIDAAAIKAHNALFPDAADKNYGDISRIDWSEVPDFDLFTMSSPCQDFSSAGLQKGGAEGSGTRSSLLWECRRAILAKKPRYILFENVKALVSDKFIRYFNKWQNELASYGYTNFAKVLNASDYGVPQNRERIFMVSILDENAHYYFPEPFKLEKLLKDVLEENVDESYYLSDERVQGLIKSTLKEKGMATEPINETPTMKITRTWAMPNRRTFTIKPFKELLERYVHGVVIDPFVNGSKLGTITNDLNPDFDTDYHLDALEFLKRMGSGSADVVLYDPPYSITQAAECYKSYGKERLEVNVANMGYWSGCKNEIARILKVGGVAVCFGWNSNGIGINRGFRMDEILICAHGGSKNDTICTVETKTTDTPVVCGAIRGRKDSPADRKHHLKLETNSPDVSNAITSVWKDSCIVIGNSAEVANTVTAHYAKEKTSDLARQSFGGGQLFNGEER